MITVKAGVLSSRGYQCLACGCRDAVRELPRKPWQRRTVGQCRSCLTEYQVHTEGKQL